MHAMSKPSSISNCQTVRTNVPHLHRTITDGVMKYFVPNVLCFGPSRSVSDKGGYSSHHSVSDIGSAVNPTE